MTQISLSDTQLVILSAAAQRDDLQIVLNDRLRGSAAKNVLAALAGKGLIELIPEGDRPARPFGAQVASETEYRISTSGLSALGIESENASDQEFELEPVSGQGADRPEECPSSMPDALPTADTETEEAAVGAVKGQVAVPRSGTRLADVLALLARPEGACMDELTAATGWLPHTTRAALTGLRKRGYSIERSKREGGITSYRIQQVADLQTSDQSEAA